VDCPSGRCRVLQTSWLFRHRPRRTSVYEVCLSPVTEQVKPYNMLDNSSKGRGRPSVQRSLVVSSRHVSYSLPGRLDRGGHVRSADRALCRQRRARDRPVPQSQGRRRQSSPLPVYTGHRHRHRRRTDVHCAEFSSPQLAQQPAYISTRPSKPVPIIHTRIDTLR